MSMVLNLSYSLCIWISAAVVIVYTVLGGLYSVASTDVIQISLVLLGVVGSSEMVMLCRQLNILKSSFFFVIDCF